MFPHHWEFLLFLVPAVTKDIWERQSPRELADEGGTISVTEKCQEGQSGGNCVVPDDHWWRKRRRFVWQAVAGVLLWNVLLWFVTIENLGGEITASSPWPVIKVMQLIRLPGGFLERFDILLAVFWILCLVGGAQRLPLLRQKNRRGNLWRTCPRRADTAAAGVRYHRRSGCPSAGFFLPAGKETGHAAPLRISFL